MPVARPQSTPGKPPKGLQIHHEMVFVTDSGHRPRGYALYRLAPLSGRFLGFYEPVADRIAHQGGS